jgi:predicted nucleotide-binding protein
MAQRRNKQIIREKTLLIKSNSVFKNELTERINLGNKIIENKIENLNSLMIAKHQFSEWSDYNLELLKQSFNVSGNEYWRSYDNAGMMIGLYSVTVGAGKDSEQIISEFLRKINSKIDYLTKLKNKVNLLKSTEIDVIEITENSNKLNMSQVFIVHGHDNLVKTETARFIEKLGFEPIILHEKASSGQTIIEKIENYSNVGFGIILYTPCDLGTKKDDESNLRPRARQNVVFEHGFLIGKIGRNNVCALVKENVEIPNDISGVVYLSLERDWKIDLAKELRNSGYKVDMNLVI